ncbi:MAG TPA: PTS transporter subunit IIC [Treponemataceae bacterium]|nr:PTS transporter subunit IIC [Treponemataceae bacterium]
MDRITSLLSGGLSYFLSFKPYVMLPVIILIVSLAFGIKWSAAVKSALQLGIAFIGIFMTFDFFVALIKPVTEALIARSGLSLNVLDVGWPPLAAITWSFSLAPVLLIGFLIVNMLMLFFKLTKTVDIDIWNFWHVIFIASLVYFFTDNYLVATGVSLVCFVLTLKLAEWSAPMIAEYSGMEAICVPHLSAITHFPLARFGVRILSAIPFIKDVRADPEHIKAKLGIVGEPMILGFLLGGGLALGGGYDIKGTLELAFGFAAVIFILPIMGGVLGSALLPVSEGMKAFLEKRLPGRGTTYIGLDVAVLFGVPATIMSAVIMIPISIGLAFVLPGVRFIPLGDLTNLMVPMSIICAATRGNIVHSVIIGIPVVVGNLYLATALAPTLTEMAARANYPVAGGQEFTSFLDGGQLFRGWIAELFAGHPVAIALIPAVLFFVLYAWYDARKTAKGI